VDIRARSLVNSLLRVFSILRRVSKFDLHPTARFSNESVLF